MEFSGRFKRKILRNLMALMISIVKKIDSKLEKLKKHEAISWMQAQSTAFNFYIYAAVILILILIIEIALSPESFSNQ